MKKFNFFTYLTSNLKIEEGKILSILENCKLKRLSKGAFLLRANERCSHTFFVEKGLLVQYSLDEKGRQHILNFAPEGWFISDRASVYFQEPSQYFIQANEDTRVALIDENFFKRIESTIPSFRDFNYRLLHNHIRSLQNRTISLLSETAEKRYLNFITAYPDIPLRVPQAMIASYLGIAAESLSRVRRELAKKNFKIGS